MKVELGEPRQAMGLLAASLSCGLHYHAVGKFLRRKNLSLLFLFLISFKALP
jgi:hypothetical protein